MQSNISQFRDSDVQSAGDIMRKMGMPSNPVDFVTGKVISRKSLPGSTRYSYCPFCYQRVKRAGDDFRKVLKPLQSVTYKNLYRIGQGGDAKILYEKTLECTVCRERDGKPRKITLDDFSGTYAESYRQEKNLFVNLNDRDAVRRAGFENFADFSEGF